MAKVNIRLGSEQHLDGWADLSAGWAEISAMANGKKLGRENAAKVTAYLASDNIEWWWLDFDLKDGTVLTYVVDSGIGATGISYKEEYIVDDNKVTSHITRAFKGCDCRESLQGPLRLLASEELPITTVI